MTGEPVEERTGGKASQGYVVAVMGALAGAVVGGLVGLTILILVLDGVDVSAASLDDFFDHLAWGFFLVLIVLPLVCFLVGGGGTYLLLRWTGHRAPLRTGLYSVVLTIPCVFAVVTLVDGSLAPVGLVAASLLARRLALASADVRAPDKRDT
jgi:hypothetical protein